MPPDDVTSGEPRGNNSEEYKADILDEIPSDFIPHWKNRVILFLVWILFVQLTFSYVQVISRTSLQIGIKFAWIYNIKHDKDLIRF